MYLTGGGKVIAAGKLIEILESLPDGSFIEPNLVGNLRVTDRSGADYLGWIDLRSETFREV